MTDVRYRVKFAGKYFLRYYEGSTTRREDAHLYTIQELSRYWEDWFPSDWSRLSKPRLEMVYV